MNSRVETEVSKLDTVKLAVALLLIVGGVVAFYLYPEQSTLLRTLGLLVVVGIAGAIAYQTDKGRQTWGFFQDAQIEVRKVVWPSRQETVQTTLLVILMVIVVALIMWLLDMFLGWAIRLLIGQ
ncbi:preprotein translocase subunit SecE [Methylohalomonas lacus]|uniref:Protein translocase subunit SecE n=1 Tax=Methylohalomonas lacus TaxID=398773 RepID=A0AAE3HLK3_9GAMM|nr:preprotein translocase subunit SecE [Methylohalomonas lacus]MCS3904581.1 preprotein translocase subunit SecE [Methylohalomonas lacus]